MLTVGRVQKYILIKSFIFSLAAWVAQRVKAFTSQEEDWLFESHPRQTYVVKTGSDISTAKRSSIGVCVTGPRK